jgi:chromosome segregation ATPase
VKLQERVLAVKSESLQFLITQVQAHADVAQALCLVREGFTGDAQVNLQTLRSLPLEELEATVERLQQELNKLSSFVNDQEEELELQRQEIGKLEDRILKASEYERLSLASDLEQEQQQCRLLDETLEGQRKTLQEREGVLHLHQDILKQRQMGKSNRGRQSIEVKLEPILQQLEFQQEESDQQIQTLKNEVVRMQASIQDAQDALANNVAMQQVSRSHLEARDQVLQEQRSALAELWGKVDACQAVLQPLQDVVDRFRNTISHASDNGSVPTAQPQQVVAELKQVLMALGKAPDLTPA